MPAAVARLGEVVAALDSLYDPGWAEPWDAVGLVCGDPDAPVRRVLFAIDPVEVVADEAVAQRAELLVTHHPLFLRPVHGVATTTAKGRLVHRLVSSGIALHVVHTNADVADPGVSDSLARALGLSGVRPLEPAPADAQDKLVTFVPVDAVDGVIDALAEAGAGTIGDYTRCAYSSPGTGTFRAGQDTHPVIGTVGAIVRVAEQRVEMVLPRSARGAVIAAVRAAHPYEEPAFDVYELASLPGRRGIGRVGTLPQEQRLSDFVAGVAAALPPTAHGLRVAGDPERNIRTVAVCGGAGDAYLDAARAVGADAYLTADLRHHRASEARADDGPALVDAAHWATEWPWLADAAARLREALTDGGTTVETAVSSLVTDPWTSSVSQGVVR